MRLAGRCTTSIDWMRPGSSFWARDSARNEAMLKSSEPQNRILSGGMLAGDDEWHRRWAGTAAAKERTGPDSLHSMVGSRCEDIREGPALQDISDLGLADDGRQSFQAAPLGPPC